MDNIRAHLIIEGRVQGVWFRDSTRNEAARLNITGWVKNRFDGSVELIAEGSRQDVEKLIDNRMVSSWSSGCTSNNGP